MTLKSSARPLASAVVYKKESVSKMDTQKRGIVMGFRFRKSVNLGGVRFTASKSGVSTSVGGKGFRVTKHANGKVSSTASIPGTGISYTSNLSSSKSFNSEEPEDYHGYSQYTDNSDFPEEDDRPAFLPKEVIDSLNLDAFLAYSENFLSWAKKLGTNGYYVTPEEFEEVRKIVRYINESTAARQDPNFEKNRRAAQKLAEKEKAKELAQQQAAQKLAEKEKAKELAQQQAAQKLAEKEKAKELAQRQAAQKLAEKEKTKELAQQQAAQKLAEKEKAKELAQRQAAQKLDKREQHGDDPSKKPGCWSVFFSIFFVCFMIMSGAFEQPHVALIAFLICFILTLPIPALLSFWERMKLTKNWRIGLICLVFFFGGGIASKEATNPVADMLDISLPSSISSSQSSTASSTPAVVSSSTQSATESSSIPSTVSSEVALSASSEVVVPPVSSSAAPQETSPESVSAPKEEQKTMVWIADGGTKYHRRSSCSNMKNPQQIELEQAISWGYESCKRCH